MPKSAQVSASALAVPHSRIRDIADLAMARGPEVLRLFFGESNLPTPAFIQEAASRAMRDGYTFYTENAGLPSLREAISRYYSVRHAVSLDPASELIVTASGVQALNLGIRCALDPGDEAIVLTPAWQNQLSITRMHNGVVREVALRFSQGRYHVDFDALAAAVSAKTRLLIYTSPSNPTGWVATIEEQQGLLEFARRHGLWLLADEVYERLWYCGAVPGEPAPSILRLATRQDPVLVVQSFSKSYCMTGWRLGWIAARADFARRATQLNEFIISSAPAFAQKAGEAALEHGEPFIREILAMYKSNRDLACTALRNVPGVEIPQPDGAFYIFPRLEGLSDSFELCRRILDKESVGLAPGVAFGLAGEGALRLCYAIDPAILAEALTRLRSSLLRTE